jgi:hypothetical protein
LFKQFCFQKCIDTTNKITIFFLFLFIIGSIFIGFYLVFFTNIGKDIAWKDSVPLNFLILDAVNITNLQFTLGITFLFFWLVYLIVYSINIFKPVFLFNGLKNKQSSDYKFKIFDLSNSNYIYITLQWFSAYFVLSIIIDLVQQLFGISIGNPLLDNPLVSFFYLTAAPLNEEILFRVIFLGIPLSLIFFKFGNSFISTLIHPSKNVSVESRNLKILVFLIIFFNSVFFGLSHVIFGGTYEIGKITQASLGGLFLGWLYYRYGLGTSIIFHWISNYVLYSYSLLGYLFFNTSLTDESSNIFLILLSVGFTINGIIFLYKYSEKIFKIYKKKGSK